MQDTIHIPLDSKLVKIYDDAPTEIQGKLQILVSLWLRALDSPKHKSLSHLMNEISDKAAAHGLTPEIFETLVSDDE